MLLYGNGDHYKPRIKHIACVQILNCSAIKKETTNDQASRQRIDVINHTVVTQWPEVRLT